MKQELIMTIMQNMALTIQYAMIKQSNVKTATGKLQDEL